MTSLKDLKPTLVPLSEAQAAGISGGDFISALCRELIKSAAQDGNVAGDASAGGGVCACFC